MTPAVAVVAVLVVYRLTLLVVADDLTEPLRDRIVSRYVHPTHELEHFPRHDDFENVEGYAYSARCRCGERWVGDEWSDVAGVANGHVNQHRGEMTRGPWWVDVLDCPWCASMYLAPFVTWSAWCFGSRSWWFVPALALAASGVTGAVSTYARPHAKTRH